MPSRGQRSPESDGRVKDDYGGRRPTDAELARRFVAFGGFTETQAWAAVRFIRGPVRGRGARAYDPRRRSSAA